MKLLIKSNNNQVPKIKRGAKSKPLAYFKSESGRYGGIKIYRFYKIMDDGAIKVVDLTRLSTNTIRSFGSIPVKLMASNAREYNKALRQVINNHYKNY